MKLPEAKSYVSLSEALSWAAFRCALNDKNLKNVIEKGAMPPLDRHASLNALVSAVRQFSDSAASGLIRVRARRVQNFWCDTEAALADTIDIEAKQLRDFSQFDGSVLGLRRQPPGQPSLIWNGHPKAYTRTFDSQSEIAARKSVDGGIQVPGFAEGLRAVEVFREDLMREFPRAQVTMIGSPPPGPWGASLAGAQRQCERWLRQTLRLSPASKGKQEFRKEALSQISGLSGRAFDRAWATVAPEFDRTNPGRKSKHQIDAGKNRDSY